MDAIDKLARKLVEMNKANQNPPSVALRTGEVVELNPLKIQWGENVILTEDKLVLPEVYTTGYQIPNRYMNTNGSMVEETIPWKLSFAVGDKVVISPDEYLKIWYVLWKVG
ncbi:DUF2577 family protein [Paenibacillus oleatilyticus]|uniref:DUF2577 family protein n=1 Tax=Paenibacillus oleatilyticus TaxID=2594886 RepID=UPI001C1FBC8D|nr:DUF2577 family protein [Paenibacillus oleatilyticus]MBU7320270.1 DUF2577 domain-containing protein [Paenibacillus oleatilyticus]